MSDDKTAVGQQWAKVIQDGSRASGVAAIINAVNDVARSRIANRADVMVACAQLLAQNIVPGGPFIAAEVRQGVLALIDGYGMRVATDVE